MFCPLSCHVSLHVVCTAQQVRTAFMCHILKNKTSERSLLPLSLKQTQVLLIGELKLSACLCRQNWTRLVPLKVTLVELTSSIIGVCDSSK